ncbi:MAG: hypothetical protein ACEPOZ_11010 [Marinifilaceae bacterium]|jgi:hypothetical protein
MKTLKNLKNVKELNRKQQQEIKGGFKDLCDIIMCIPEAYCVDGKCVRRDPLLEM